MNKLSQQIEIQIEKYQDCWSRLDFTGLRRLWDPDEFEPTYLAEERDAVLIGWEDIEAYWAATRRATRRIRIETSALRARQVAADLATAVFTMRWSGEFAGYAAPIGGETRVSALFRRCGEEWLFIHYVEAPLAPLVCLRTFYERFALDAPARGPGV